MRQLEDLPLFERIVVSIHAPGRGATLLEAVGRGKASVSIHAPGRGATSTTRTIRQSRLMFQFTHPGGVRLAEGGRADAGGDVSIHAPGRGATARSVRAQLRAIVSIHAPGRGATSLRFRTPLPCSRFNSRTREGCDLSHTN